MVDELFKHGNTLEVQVKELNEQIFSLRQEVFKNEGATREFRRENSELKQRYDTLQKELGVMEHKLTDSERLASKPRSQFVDPQNPKHQAPDEASDTNSVGLNLETLAGQITDTRRLEHKSELYRIEEKFTGQDKALFPAFQRHIRIALSQNADRYTSLQSRISLIYQNLGNEPQSFLDQYLSADGIFNLPSVESVWNILDVFYRNPNEEEEARATLNVLRQKNRGFGAYLAEFQKYRMLSSITDEGTLIAYMRAGVSKEMRSQISQQQIVTRRYTFSEFVELCKECELRLDLNRPPPQLVPSPGMTRNYHPEHVLRPPHRPEIPSQQFYHKSGIEFSSPATGSNHVPLGGDPMILDSARLSHLGPDGKITFAERKRRYETNSCMRCGKPGHRAENCN